jgi:hypothetical protein
MYSIVASAKPDLVGYLALNIDPSNSDLLDPVLHFPGAEALCCAASHLC